MTELYYTILAIAERTNEHLPLLLGILGFMLLVYILTILTGYRLLIFGIIPRHLFGLLGIFGSPFLHGSFNHLFFNAIPFFVLSNFVLVYGVTLYLNVSLYIICIGGFLTWCFARKALHVGGSGWITGLWSYLVVNAYQTGGVMATLLGLVSIYYFAAILFGIFPQGRGISWESHLFGFIAGILTHQLLYYFPLLYPF